MDRLILQPGAIPLDTDGGSIQRNAMVALGYLAQAMLGTSTVVDGLACTPTSPATMVVNVGQGSIFALETIDTGAFGSLALDSNPLIKMGINSEGVTPFTLAAPGTSGQSINYLIEATFQEADGTPVVLPYYNPANPAVPYSGPGNSGASQNTVRAQKVELQLKAGTAATTGTQATPAVDAGWVGLYVVTVNFGQVTVTSTSIAVHPNATFIGVKLPNVSQNTTKFITATGAGTFTVPPGVYNIRSLELWGGGASGGATNNTQAGSGGGPGAYCLKENIAVTPGQTCAYTVGAGGAAQASVGFNGNAGATTTITVGANTYTAGGGSPGTGGSSGSQAGGAGGTATGGDLNIGGGQGAVAGAASNLGADGGSAPRGGPGGRGSSGVAGAGTAPGGAGGGSGGVGSAPSGAGANGMIIIRV